MNHGFVLKGIFPCSFLLYYCWLRYQCWNTWFIYIL